MSTLRIFRNYRMRTSYMPLLCGSMNHWSKICTRKLSTILCTKASERELLAPSTWSVWKHTVRNYGRYEPDYLDPKGIQIAHYDAVNFQIKGYDFCVLEAFGKFVHNSGERFGLNVEDAWATPCKKLKITRLKPESTVVDSEYKLEVYERNVQVSNVPSTVIALFIDIIHSSMPAGITLRVQPHFKEYTEVRYVPDFELKEVKEQLSALLDGRKKK